MIANFLLGAGISNPAGIKQTEEITKILLSGEQIVRGTAENYYFDVPQNYTWDLFQKKKDRAVKLLNIVKQDYDKYYKKYQLKANYESLYYFINFIHQEMLGGLENHSIYYFFEKHKDEMKKLYTPIEPSFGVGMSKEDLFKETENYIKWIVFHLLNKKVGQYTHLKFLTNCVEDHLVEKLNIFTLNNDTILEQCFENNGIEYVDGFKTISSNVHKWDVTTFDNIKTKVHLVKNHGSINWFYADRTDWYNKSIIKNEQGNAIREVDLPIFLIGTFNKEALYLQRLFLDIFYTFYRKLDESNILIVSGYSFGDKAINEKIIDWYYSNHLNKILIIHPNCKELKQQVRPAILLRWKDWEDVDKRLYIIEKKIEQISWDEIKSKLNLQ